jgi:hypothetical protein
MLETQLNSAADDLAKAERERDTLRSDLDKVVAEGKVKTLIISMEVR